MGVAPTERTYDGFVAGRRQRQAVIKYIDNFGCGSHGCHFSVLLELDDHPNLNSVMRGPRDFAYVDFVSAVVENLTNFEFQELSRIVIL